MSAPALAADLLQSARALVGTPFRLHGRSPATGLDCIGLVGAALAACGRPVALPGGYPLRVTRPPNTAFWLAGAGLQRAGPEPQAGDIAMVRTAACQYHFAILGEATLPSAVHAHAGLRRVVEAPLPPDWPLLELWRFPSSSS